MMSEFNIPMGFRFDPTDAELIKFLILQVSGCPLPWNGVVCKDLYGPNAAPWEVFADGSGYWHIKNEGGATKSTTFVFTNLIKVPNSKRISRIAGGGTWSGQTGPKKIFSSNTGVPIGVMRMLSFKSPDVDGASSEFGHWIMHEYSLNETTKGAAADLVVCKITRSVKNNSGSHRHQPPPLFSSPASKRAAEECCFQERKVQKLCGDGFAAQFSSPAIACVEEEVMISCKEEKPGDDDGTLKTGEDDDSWLVEALQKDENTAEAAEIVEDDDSLLVKALLQDENIEPPLFEDFDDIVKSSGSLAQAAAEHDPSLQVSAPSPFDDYDFSFDMDSLLVDPLQVSAPSPLDYDFSIDTDNFLDDAAEPPLWS